MHTLTVRLREDAHQSLKELARRTGEAMSDILAKAVEEYRRKVFLEGVAQDFATLRGDKAEWQEEQKERATWDATLGDDLDEAEEW